MNRIAALVLLTVAMVGCVQQRPNTLAMFSCQDDRPFGDCVVAGSKAKPELTLHKAAGGLGMTPKAVCTKASAEVTVKITPRNQSPLGSVIIAAKDLQNAVWLLGSNSDPERPDEIRISIPENVAVGQYEYVVVDTESGDCLDPRWDVQ